MDPGVAAKLSHRAADYKRGVQTGEAAARVRGELLPGRGGDE
jgi:hypothetical protein